MPQVGRKTVPPATGVARWMNYVDPVSGNRWLTITVNGVSKDYEVEKIQGGYRLHHLDLDTLEITTYTVTIRGAGGRVWFCDCPDAKNRPERASACKHVRALRAALAKLPL